MPIHETDVAVTDVVAADLERVGALDSRLRAMVLDVLADGERPVEEIRNELGARGAERAETTVRHHVDVLREAGLVELSRVEDAGGGVRKYYRANTRLVPYDLPDDAGERLADAATVTRAGLSALLDSLAENHAAAIRAVAEDLDSSELCGTQRREEYVVRQLVTRALTDLGEGEPFEARFD
jgi:DNA-binding transcriptional ArsR family regulator